MDIEDINNKSPKEQPLSTPDRVKEQLDKEYDGVFSVENMIKIEDKEIISKILQHCGVSPSADVEIYLAEQFDKEYDDFIYPLYMVDKKGNVEQISLPIVKEGQQVKVDSKLEMVSLDGKKKIFSNGKDAETIFTWKLFDGTEITPYKTPDGKLHLGKEDSIGREGYIESVESKDISEKEEKNYYSVKDGKVTWYSKAEMEAILEERRAKKAKQSQQIENPEDKVRYSMNSKGEITWYTRAEMEAILEERRAKRAKENRENVLGEETLNIDSEQIRRELEGSEEAIREEGIPEIDDEQIRRELETGEEVTRKEGIPEIDDEQIRRELETSEEVTREEGILEIDDEQIRRDLEASEEVAREEGTPDIDDEQIREELEVIGESDEEFSLSPEELGARVANVPYQYKEKVERRLGADEREFVEGRGGRMW